MITNLKELLIFNYILHVSGMSEIYIDVRVYMVHFSFSLLDKRCHSSLQANILPNIHLYCGICVLSKVTVY